MGQRLQGVDDDHGVVEPGAAVVALGDVRTQRGDAEAGLAVDQKVDLVGEQVSVIHDSSGPSYEGRGVGVSTGLLGFVRGLIGLVRLILSYAPTPGEARAG